MKIIKYLLLTICLLTLNVNHVYAESCDNEDILRLKKLARKVEITYEQDVKEIIADDNEEKITIYDSYIISIKGLTEEIYGIETTLLQRFYFKDAKDNVVSLSDFGNGVKKIEIRSVNCNDEVLYTKKIKLPKYNYYSQDPLCEGISGEDLAVCDEWYSGEINSETLEKKVEQYKKSLQSNKNETKEEQTLKTKINNTLKFLLDNYIYLIVGITVIVIITAIIIFAKRKRSDLE